MNKGSKPAKAKGVRLMGDQETASNRPDTAGRKSSRLQRYSGSRGDWGIDLACTAAVESGVVEGRLAMRFGRSSSGYVASVLILLLIGCSSRSAPKKANLYHPLRSKARLRRQLLLPMVMPS